MVNVLVDPKDIWEFFINESGLDKKMVVIAEDPHNKVEVLLTIEDDGATLIVEKNGEEILADGVKSTNIEGVYESILDKYIYEIEPDEEDIDELYVNYDNAVCATCDLVQTYTGVDILGNMLENKQGDVIDSLILEIMEVIKKVVKVDGVFLPGIEDFAKGFEEDEEDDKK